MVTQPAMPHSSAARAALTQAERLRDAIQTWAVYVATTPGGPRGDLRSEVIDRCPYSDTYLIWIAHNLERIADRATNICEQVVFIATGERLMSLPTV